MDRLYAPWRSGYVGSADDKGGKDACIFCSMFAQSKDEEHFILRRFTHTIIMLNKYPYNSGHLMILPKEHLADLEQLAPPVLHELIELTASANAILKKATTCHALNVGLNLGKAAGGSQASHLHMHVLPRWTGDTNFLATLADTKTISLDLPKMYRELKPHFEALPTR